MKKIFAILRTVIDRSFAHGLVGQDKAIKPANLVFLDLRILSKQPISFAF